LTQVNNDEEEQKEVHEEQKSKLDDHSSIGKDKLGEPEVKINPDD
jgi:hypothetical protein